MEVWFHIFSVICAPCASLGKSDAHQQIVLSNKHKHGWLTCGGYGRKDILDEFSDISDSCLSNISVMIRSKVITDQGNQQLVYESYSYVS